MAGKLFFVLFAFVALQGWTSAFVVTNDNVLDLIEDVVENSDALFSDLWNEVTVDNDTDDLPELEPKDPKKCLPYVRPAWRTVAHVRSWIKGARPIVQELHEGATKCQVLTDTTLKRHCYQNLKQVAAEKGKRFKEAYLTNLKPNISRHIATFEKCMYN